jgi:hypothetical protein
VSKDCLTSHCLTCQPRQTGLAELATDRPECCNVIFVLMLCLLFSFYFKIYIAYITVIYFVLDNITEEVN